MHFFASLFPHANLLRYNRLCHILLFLRSTFLFVCAHICVGGWYCGLGTHTHLCTCTFIHIETKGQLCIAFHRCYVYFVSLFCWDSMSHWPGNYQIGYSGWFCDPQGSVSPAPGLQAQVTMPEFFFFKLHDLCAYKASILPTEPRLRLLRCQC